MPISVLPFDREHDVVVIGSGPGGEGAAMKLAKSGLSVVMVEKHSQVGGGCTHWATIPSKALRHAVQRVGEFRADPLFAGLSSTVRFTFPQLLEAADRVIRKQVAMRRDFYLRNHVSVVHGVARFIDEHTIDVNGRTLHAKNFIIATGTRPYRPKDIDFTHPRVRDSDTILQLDHTPETIAIFGAGVIGCEYASIFRNLGVKVNLINGRSELLSFLDSEIIDALSYHLRDQGVVLRHNEQHKAVETRDDGVILHLESGKKIKSDVVLWAQGRSGNTEELALHLAGISPNSRGQLDVDENFCVLGSKHIYAVGDVIGAPGLASASYDQGRYAATFIADGEADSERLSATPTGIYTSPEISSLGRTEAALTADNVPYEVGISLFRSLARAQITGNTVGMLKLLFHRETLELLGIHCFGDQAAEIVHIGQAIMRQPGAGNTIEYFVKTTFNYPTMAEAYRVAALNGLNRLC